MANKHDRLRSFKWVVALVLFGLALTVTFSEVYGTESRSFGDKGNIGSATIADHPTAMNTDQDAVESCQSSNPPAAIPEPTTILLLAGGLSAIYIARRRGRAK